MATRTTTKPAPEYDFDSWSDDAEEKAIAALVPDVRHIIVEKRFIGRFVDGTIVEMPLSLSLDDVDSLEAEATSPVDQMKALLTRLGGEKATREFSRHDIAETSILAQRYFGIITRIAGASLPE